MTSSNNAYPPASYIRERFDGFERDVKGLTAHIQRLETDLGERITASNTAVDRARVRGDDGMHDLITRTANAIYAEVKKLEQRIEKVEETVHWYAPVTPDNDPESPVDTSWHPYNVHADGVVGDRPPDYKDIIVMYRNGEITGPWLAMPLVWGESGDTTIVAWRYAKEGE